MNSEELKIYTLLTHPTAPQSYHISDNGTKIWSIVDGSLVYFEGENLDSMSATSLFFWYQEKLKDYRFEQWNM